MYELPEQTRRHYTALRYIPAVGWCGAHRLLFHWTMHYGISDTGYDGRYCYETEAQTLASMAAWSGHGDPEHWHKHPPTGRLRNIETGAIWHESEIGPRA